MKMLLLVSLLCFPGVSVAGNCPVLITQDNCRFQFFLPCELFPSCSGSEKVSTGNTYDIAGPTPPGYFGNATNSWNGIGVIACTYDWACKADENGICKRDPAGSPQNINGVIPVFWNNCFDVPMGPN